jgi:uncharacterized membrane protein YbaN (DUF454 family)
MTFPKPVFITLVLTIAFWLFMFGQQVYHVWYSFAVGSDDPTVNAIAHHYAITNSIQLLAFIGIAAVLSMAVYMFRSPWAATALAVLSAAAGWHYFFVGTSAYFRPPFGDGSWSGALSAYCTLNAKFLFLHILQSITLFALLILWPLCASRLRHAHERSA